jgi:hypothetical protein
MAQSTTKIASRIKLDASSLFCFTRTNLKLYSANPTYISFFVLVEDCLVVVMPVKQTNGKWE